MVRENVAPQISRQLVDFLSHLNKVISLKLELAALVDVGLVFVEANYILEGDGSLVCHALRHYKEFAMHVRMYIYPVSLS